MAAPRKEVGIRMTDEHLEELGRLADTAGAEVVGTLRQRIDSPHPRFYIGEGKVGELRERIEETGADLVLFDEELSPAQGKNLEISLDVRVMDRSELILDIFATRARTREAKLQVELAQLEYLLPRLTRMWNHLSRIRGGIGLRGPGETQLETDRRMIGVKIADLKERLRGVAQARETQRRARQGSFRAALVGYTNAGKSSLLRALSGSDVFVEDRLFATLDSTSRSVRLGSGQEAIVTDTVGFIRKLPHHLVASFRSTLEEAREADLLLHVMDVSHPEWEEQAAVVREVLASLELEDRPTLLVLNKVDLLTPEERNSVAERLALIDPAPHIFVSALAEGGIDPLAEALEERYRERLVPLRVSFPASEGKLFASLHREGEVLEVREKEGEVEVHVRLPHAAAQRIRASPGARVMDGEER